jgi:F-type H+-transporting ATPase subunit b
MPSLVHQIGELFLRAVPVAVIVLIFYLVLKSLFFKPLLKVMAERDARTLGAQKEAEAAQATAAEEVKQYEDALRHARAKVYAEQEAARKKFMDERAAFLKDVRAKVNGEVNAAKERIAGEFDAAKKEIEASVPQLAAQIAGRVLQAPPTPLTPAREVR